jgi:hypothetical protein
MRSAGIETGENTRFEIMFENDNADAASDGLALTLTEIEKRFIRKMGQRCVHRPPRPRS